VLLGCSGGLDSTAAAAVLTELQLSLGHELVLVHIDHGLRAGSADDGDHVERLAGNLNVEIARRKLELAPGANLQGRARTARYGVLLQVMKDAGCRVVATAHHADDQAETLVMRASRGAGLSALAGIRRRSGHVVRPLLDISRAAIARFAATNELGWREDPSNEDTRFSRNALRHDVFPALETAIPGAAEGLARTAANLAEHAATLEYWLGALFDEYADDVTRSVRFPLVLLHDAPVSAVGAWVRAAAGRLGVASPSQRAQQQIYAFMRSGPSPGNPCEVAGMRLTVDGKSALLTRADIARGLCAD